MEMLVVSAFCLRYFYLNIFYEAVVCMMAMQALCVQLSPSVI